MSYYMQMNMLGNFNAKYIAYEFQWPAFMFG